MDTFVELWSEHRAFPVDDCLADRADIGRALANDHLIRSRFNVCDAALGAGRERGWRTMAGTSRSRRPSTEP